jgi:hypothetical protein
MSPITGGNSEAFAMPRLKGSARRNTMNPEGRSEEKFSTNPAHPSLGSDFKFASFIITYFFENRNNLVRVPRGFVLALPNSREVNQQSPD